MTAQILDGKMVAANLQNALQQKIASRKTKGLRAPALAVILVGQDPASVIYVNNKRKACQAIGLTSHAFDLPENTSENDLLTLIDSLNNDETIDGILVQLPLPTHIDTQLIIETINPCKDVDGFHPYNLGRLVQKKPLLRPCTPYGIIQLLDWYHLDLKGLNAVIIGASNIVGRPMLLELLMAGSTVTICHRQTRDLQKQIIDADLLVVAAGEMDLIHPDWIRQNSIVVDVGIHRLPNGRLRGDLNFEVVSQKAAWITPVPFGVGPMTITTLLSNTLSCMEQKYDVNH